MRSPYVAPGLSRALAIAGRAPALRGQPSPSEQVPDTALSQGNSTSPPGAAVPGLLSFPCKNGNNS